MSPRADMMDWYPKTRRSQIPALLGITAVGVVVAGLYGAIHDQISFTISPEYFTKLKFQQFAWANFGFPERVFAAEVGFLGTWWVGLFAGWLLARAGLARMWTDGDRRSVIIAIAILPIVTALFGVGGAMLGQRQAQAPDLSSWQLWRDRLDLHDVRGFIVVYYVHWAGYIGAVVGVLASLGYVRSRSRSNDP